MRAMVKEFREFTARGNVMDLAVAVVMGVAFGAITTSLVNDVIMPVVGVLLGNADFANLAIVLREATDARPAVTLGYGQFINACVNFLIVAFAMFMLVKGMNRLKRREEAAPADEKAVPPPRQEVLLEEIRDLLKAEKRTD